MNIATASRPSGRLIFFALVTFLIVTGSVTAHADFTKTIVHDVMNRADGSPATGTLLISWPSFRTASNDLVAAGSATAQLGADGSFSVSLAPTDGATPAGVQYRVVLQLTGASPVVEYWVVPAVGQTGIHLASSGGGSSAARPPAADPGQFILKAGDSMTGPLTLAGPPSGPNDAASKQYVDDSVAPSATKQYVDTSFASTASKAYVDSSIASAFNSAASKQYVDSAVANARASVSVKDFGAICDGAGAHDDTAAIQAAINSFAGKGGVLRIPDGCRTGALTFPTVDGVHRGNLALQLEGSLLLAATLELPANITLTGVAGSSAVQFQIGPSARLEAWVNTIDPVLKLTGGNNYVENITIPWGAGTGIRLDGAHTSDVSALTRLSSVGIFVNGRPLVIDNYFWVWARDSRFLNTGTTDAIWITNSSTATPGRSGIIYLDDDIIAGGGIRVDSQIASSNIGNVYVNRMIRESGVGPLVTLDTTNGDIESITLDHVADADPANVQDQVHIISPTPAGHVYGLHIKGQPPTFGGDTIRAQVFFDGDEDTRFNDVSLGAQRFWNYSVRSRVWDIENIADDTAFVAVPFASMNVNQDPTTWPTGGGTWTQGVLAPDGSTQAATLSIASGIADAQIYRVTGPVSAGDWVIAGVYVKGATLDPAQPAFAFNAVNLPLFEHNTSYFSLTPRGFYDSQWRLALTYAKVTAAADGIAEYILSLRADSNHTLSYAFPFLMRVPASAAISEAEIQRWTRSLTRNIVSGVPAANYAVRAHQSLYFGSDTYLSRIGAGQLGMNGNALALASDLAAKADAAATTTALANKADAAATTTALAGKADAAATTTALAGKQNALGFTPLNPANNLSEISSATTARTNLGLGSAATKNAPASGNAAAGDVVLGSDTRLNDARTPTAHTHTESDVTGLSTDLAAKADAAATTTALAAKADANTLSAHVSATAAHGASGAIVGTTNTQTLQNKTLDSTNSVAAAAISGNITGNAAGFTGSLAGDVTGTQSVTVVNKVRGVTYTASPSTDTVPVITAANTASYQPVPDCQDATGKHLNYTASTHAFSCGTTSVAGGPVPEWSTGPSYATSFSITAPAQNTTRLWALFVPDAISGPTKVTYYVNTADNTSNFYDLGIYGSTGTLLCHTGALAGTTFSSATGVKNISFLSGCGTMNPGRYYMGMTTTCSSSCAALAQTYVVSATGTITPVSAANPTSSSTTSSGVLNSSVGIPTDTWVAGQMPAIFLHQ
jgi:hypothetical protein